MDITLSSREHMLDKVYGLRSWSWECAEHCSKCSSSEPLCRMDHDRVHC